MVSFAAALKRYIRSGYKAPDAMRAVWHDVKVGRVARPRRRRAMTVQQRRTAMKATARGINPRRRRRNPVAGFEHFDLADRAGWERAIRAAGGLRVSRAERGEFAEVPGYLKGYKRGVAPDELAEMIATERGSLTCGTGWSKYTTRLATSEAAVTPRSAPHMSRVDT